MQIRKWILAVVNPQRMRSRPESKLSGNDGAVRAIAGIHNEVHAGAQIQCPCARANIAAVVQREVSAVLVVAIQIEKTVPIDGDAVPDLVGGGVENGRAGLVGQS